MVEPEKALLSEIKKQIKQGIIDDESLTINDIIEISVTMYANKDLVVGL